MPGKGLSRVRIRQIGQVDELHRTSVRQHDAFRIRDEIDLRLAIDDHVQGDGAVAAIHILQVLHKIDVTRMGNCFIAE